MTDRPTTIAELEALTEASRNKTVNALCRAHADACRDGDAELAGVLRRRLAHWCGLPNHKRLTDKDRGTAKPA